MLRGYTPFLIALALIFCLAGGAAASADWDIRDDVLRLSDEAPSLAAYDDIDRFVWLAAHDYILQPDGTMSHLRRLLLMYSDKEPRDYKIVTPFDESASVRVKNALLLDPDDGSVVEELTVGTSSENGVTVTVITVPPSAKLHVAAIEYETLYPRRYYLDDLLVLAGDDPIWEQNITVSFPEGMTLYWQGNGVREPLRQNTHGAQIVTWKIVNQQNLQKTGLVAQVVPTLLFSLQNGHLHTLKRFAETAGSLIVPDLPASIKTRGKSNLARTGRQIDEYLRSRALSVDGRYLGGFRHDLTDGNESWTSWERTIIMAKWLRNLGWDVKVYWAQRRSSDLEGPACNALWLSPVLEVTADDGTTVYYMADQTVEFGRMPPQLYEKPVYYADVAEVRFIKLPKGPAADHMLTQTWRVSLTDTGVAEGTLELNMSGGWMETLEIENDPTPESYLASTAAKFFHTVKGLELEVVKLNRSSLGCKVVYNVRAPIGIVSGTDMLTHYLALVPTALEELYQAKGDYSLKFPFIIEHNMYLKTPKGLRALSIPEKSEAGDKKTSYVQNFAFWPKRALVESSCKWAVRLTEIDSYVSGTVVEQCNAFNKYVQTAVPLRGK